MVTVAVLSSDQRLSFQIHTWLKEVSANVRWEIHSDLSAFAQKIETENALDVIALSQSSNDDLLDSEDIGSGQSKSMKDAFYRLLIVDLDLMNLPPAQVVDWVIKIKKSMSDRDRSDPKHPVKLLLLSFDGGSFRVDAYCDAAIDDLILKPLDRSVFLQKVEIMTSDDPGLKPTFLFRQKTNITIEIGKDAVIDEISEFSLAIRNPAPLANGVYASIHCDLLGPADFSRVIGRVYRSEPHPRFEGQYLVRFAYFGLRSDQHANVKKYVRDRQPPPKHRPLNPEMADNDPAIPFNRVAVIDMNPDIFVEIQSAMKDHYVGVQTTHYFSYARFLASVVEFIAPAVGLQVVPATASAPPAGASGQSKKGADDAHGLRAWTFTGDLTFTIAANLQEPIRFDSSLTASDVVLGRTRSEWKGRGREFFGSLESLDTSELQEMISYALSGGTGRGYLQIKDQANRLYFVKATATLAKAAEGDEPAQLQFVFKQVEKFEYETGSASSDAKAQSLDLLYDAIFIDISLIRGDLQPWYDGLHETLLKADILSVGMPMPKIILMADEKSRSRPEDFRTKIVSDFLFKPLDRKMMSFKAKIAVNELIPRKEPEIPPFVTAGLPAKLAKDAQMEALSEYGLTVAHRTPFKKGAMMRFFSPLFGSSVDGILCRCTHCEIKKEKQVSYTCHFMFFGTSDENLKRIRNWIREDYVQRKEAP